MLDPKWTLKIAFGLHNYKYFYYRLQQRTIKLTLQKRLPSVLNLFDLNSDKFLSMSVKFSNFPMHRAIIYQNQQQTYMTWHFRNLCDRSNHEKFTKKITKSIFSFKIWLINNHLCFVSNLILSLDKKLSGLIKTYNSQWKDEKKLFCLLVDRVSIYIITSCSFLKIYRVSQDVVKLKKKISREYLVSTA